MKEVLTQKTCITQYVTQTEQETLNQSEEKTAPEKEGENSGAAIE